MKRMLFFVAALGLATLGTAKGPNDDAPIAETTSTYELKEQPGVWDLVYDWCQPVCKGQKHKKHSECDASCDSPCRNTHGMKLHPFYDLNLTALNSHIAAFPAARNEISRDLHEYLDKQLERVVETPKGHFAPPCTQVCRTYSFRRYAIILHTKYSERGVTKSGLLYNKTGSYDGEVGLIDIPEKDPIHTASYVDCACEEHFERPAFARPGHTSIGATLSPGMMIGPPGLIPYPYYPSNPFFNDVIFSGVDLDHLDVEGVRDGWIVYFPGGETFYCDDPECQGEVTMYDQWNSFHLGSSSDTTWSPKPLSWGGPRVAPEGTGTLTFETLCTDIGKRQPRPGDHFKPAEEQDQALRRFSIIANWENVHGPWDQARVWIYRNHATLDQINHRVVLGTPPGRYVQCLYECEREAMIDLSGDEYKKLFEPAHALDPFGNRKSTLWFIQKLDALNPDGLAKTLDSGLKDWIAKLQDNDRDYPHVVDVIDGLDSCLSPELRGAADKVIDALPAEAKSRIEKKLLRSRAKTA
jgi:hypothetical protein